MTIANAQCLNYTIIKNESQKALYRIIMSEEKNRPNYANPPVQEIGIGFSFDNSRIKTDFDKIVNVFHTNNRIEFPVIEQQGFLIPIDISSETSKADESKDESKNEIVMRQERDRYVLSNVSHRRVIVIKDSYFSFRVLRNEEGNFPKYSVVYPEALKFFESFSGEYSTLKELQLVYRDEIEIPIGESFDANDYFRIGVNLPEALDNTIQNLDLSLKLDIPADQLLDSSLEIAFSCIKPQKEGNLRFRFVWLLDSNLAKSLPSPTKESIIQHLDAMHEQIYRYFDASFTDQCKSSFK